MKGQFKGLLKGHTSQVIEMELLEESLDFLKFYLSVNLTRGKKEKIRDSLENSKELKRQFKLCKKNLSKIYRKGYGFKSIRKLFISRGVDVGYSELRGLMENILKIEARKGYNVITPTLRKFRAKKMSYESRERNRLYPTQHITTTICKGVQGYYFNKSLQKYVWLRSSYEYIYAKWLDTQNVLWDVEVQSFRLNDGRYYRPDFFIYNKKMKLKKIVEVKGGFDLWNRDKHKQLKLDKIEIVLIRKITDFLEKGKSLNQERELWKAIRKMQREL
jgi:hypothetical protein